jgi:hypothetical protein
MSAREPGGPCVRRLVRGFPTRPAGESDHRQKDRVPGMRQIVHP